MGRLIVDEQSRLDRKQERHLRLHESVETGDGVNVGPASVATRWGGRLPVDGRDETVDRPAKVGPANSGSYTGCCPSTLKP